MTFFEWAVIVFLLGILGGVYYLQKAADETNRHLGEIRRLLDDRD